ncbi:MAG TPA: response regulator [Methylomirabilota bacterium]|jgi:CheY-like chemotaxis protein|nr:response regulator [Methylomirabilota bacterium]
MRILVVDDSSPHRRMLTAIFGQDGHDVLTAADGEAALALLEREAVDAVVSDVRMPKVDGFQLCRAIRRDPRWSRLPFIFYSSVFIGGPARDLGRDVGATAYLDAKDFTPQQMARELEGLVARHVRAEYSETLVRLLDDVDFARRYHQVVLDSLGGAGREDMRDLVAESARALDAVLSRLDRERQTLTHNTDQKVEAAQLALLKELGEFLGDRINNPLAIIMASTQLLEMRAPGNATSEAAERITAAVSKINAVVREIAVRSGEAPR